MEGLNKWSNIVIKFSAVNTKCEKYCVSDNEEHQ